MLKCKLLFMLFTPLEIHFEHCLGVMTSLESYKHTDFNRAY